MVKRKSRSRRRSNPMKGWAKSSPKTGRQRSAMKKKCGTRCFLKPSINEFPICSKNSCSYSCKGLLAAKTRARQYKYYSISNKAQNRAIRAKCSWVKSRKSSRRRKRSRCSTRRRSTRRKRSRRSTRRSRH